MRIKITMILIYVQKIIYVKNSYIPHVIIRIVNIYMIYQKQFHVEIFNNLVIVLKETLVIIYMLIIILVINKNLVHLFVNNLWKKIIVLKEIIVFIDILKLYVKIMKEDFVLKEMNVKNYINYNFHVEIIY